MPFSSAQYEAVTAKLSSGMQDLSGKLNQVGPKAESTANHWYVPDAVADALIWVANKLIELGSWVLNKIEELLEGVGAPVAMFSYALDWQSHVRGPASSVAGETAPEALVAPKHWSGDAATKYTASVKGQPTAATQIETSADKIATGLNICAVAGLAFYVALAAILAKFITATIAAIVALGSVVFSWVSAVTIIEEAGVNAALIWTAVAALVAVLGAQGQQMAIIKGESVDNSTFPGGHWPDALT
ncbi:hypothetical protein [Streptomyces sp. NPDC002573]|uniref:hypothetical protein n=1 Tax=Streptomyces sp. NPDC002573 TaxID=3364651 RepID=UPI0036C57E26